jgi:hypothetical protein
MTAGADKCPRNFPGRWQCCAARWSRAQCEKEREMSVNSNHIMIIFQIKRDDDEVPRGTFAQRVASRVVPCPAGGMISFPRAP